MTDVVDRECLFFMVVGLCVCEENKYRILRLFFFEANTPSQREDRVQT